MVTGAAPTEAGEGRSLRVAYFVSRFPKVTETFILREMLELQRLGDHVELYSLIHEHEPLRHHEAAELERRARYGNRGVVRVLAAQPRWIRDAPRRYAEVWRQVLRAHWRSPRRLAKAATTTLVASMWASALRESSCERVHAHWATWPALAAWVVRELTGVPYSFTAHAHDLYLDRSMLDEKIGAADFVATISRSNRRLIEELYGPDAAAKTFVVHCGVTVDGAPAEARVRPPGDPFEILAVGALEDYKGQRYLVEACARLRTRGLRFRCRIAGDGPERPTLEALIAMLGLAGSVELVGRRSMDEVAGLLGHADVVAHPSVVTAYGKTEGIPVALIEAMGAGVPVVATNVGGVPELVVDGATGLVVPPRDPARLADALCAVAASPELATRLARAGREHVEREFALARNVGHLRELLLRWGA
ncbi:MAG TPA: glycosyltransferase family 4 protein [Acidimicrobiia bacterium]|nr:glycosyltransferase family 4 protein [Acidimicrobiia bacterium]